VGGPVGEETVPEEHGTRDGQNVALVYEQLREAILAGDMRPGEVVSQVLITRDYDVGRTPLREALRMLQHEGLVVARANRRIQIAPLSADDAEQLYVTRVALETVAARITVPLLSRRDLAEMEGWLAQMDHVMSSGEFSLIAEPHRAFHQRLVQGAGERPVTLITTLFDHAERYRRVYGAAQPDQHGRRQVEHRAMLDAAAAGDPDALAGAMAVHYVHTARIVMDAVEPGRPLHALRACVEGVAPGADIDWA
jgi:DNA-binding GntR family transcriptional regulator